MPTIALEMERLRNPYSGLGQYCYHLGRTFAEVALTSTMDFVCLLPKKTVGIFGERMKYLSVKPWHKLLPPSLGASLWHAMHQDSQYLPHHNKALLAITIHDLNFLDRADYSKAKKRRKMANLQRKISKARGLVYISDYVRQWVHQYLELPAQALEAVIYNGGSFSQELAAKARASSSPLEGPYLFSIGIHAKKNYHVLMPILAANPHYHWVIAGPDNQGYRRKIEAEAQKWGVRERLNFCGPISEEEKLSYYQHCTALLFPSLSEGFGLPVAEAMSLGKPVFLSTLTSLPEIGGKEAYYFTDFEPNTLQNTFQRGMEDFQHDPEKPQRMNRWAAQFDWQKAAGQYLNFYQKLLS